MSYPKCPHCPRDFHGLAINDTWRRFVEALRGASDAIGAFQLPPDPWLSDDSEPETPQQRALPRPSTTPPMWARQPNQRRRNRRI